LAFINIQNNVNILYLELVNIFNLLSVRLTNSWTKQTNFLHLYYVRSEYIWQDGFLFDFLQKKTADAWVRQFVIYTGFIFSERLVFENVVRFYIDYLLWPLHKYSIFETNNVSEMLNSIIFLLITIFFIYTSMYFIFFL